MKERIKKPIADIKKEIIRALLNSKYSINSPTTISDKINSNWLTTQKYCEELEKEGVLKIVKVEERKMVGVSLNLKGFLMIDEVLNEMPREDRILLDIAEFVEKGSHKINKSKGRKK